jgi:hypothetical protein
MGRQIDCYRSQRIHGWTVLSAVVIHVVLLFYWAAMHSPGADEYGHLPSGFVNNQGYMHAYRVNPPLIRMIAAMPLSLWPPDGFVLNVGSPVGDSRSEAFLVREMMAQLSWDQLWWYFFVARVLLFPLSVGSMYIAQRWVIELTGNSLAGKVVCVLWAFSPAAVTNGAMITPDMGATFFGLMFCYSLWRIHDGQAPSWRHSLLLGVLMGLAISSKFSWLILYPLVGVYFLTFSMRDFRNLWSLTLILGVSVGMLNLLYFDAIPCQLKSLQLVSETFQYLKSINLINSVPVCVSDEMILGIDRQKLDFETRFWSYFCGNWRKGGWYEYYLVGILLKTPLLTLFLAILGVSVGLRLCLSRPTIDDRIRTIFCLIMVPCIFFAFISSQTGFSHHLRYVLPVYPFLLMTSGFGVVAVQEVCAIWFKRNHMQITAFSVTMLLAVYVLDILAIFPHTQTYFNQIAGGNRNGHWYLIDSNADWGQDLYYLTNWLERHPQENVIGIELAVQFGNLLVDAPRPPKRFIPGTYIISTDRLHSRDDKYVQFLMRKPRETIGGALNVYEIYASDATPLQESKHRSSR